jgi:hypothetical protein
MLRLGDRPSSLHLTMALLIAVISRIALFFGSIIIPIPNEAGLPISPLTANTALDLNYYQWARGMYFGEIQLAIDTFVQFYMGHGKIAFFLPGPLYPGLLHVFDYGPENTLPLSGIYLLLSMGLVAAWLWWLWRNGLSRLWLYIFAVLPTPYWFMLNVSTDLLFAGVVAAFWLLWFDQRVPDLRRMAGVAVVVVIAALLRPNALSLLLFLCIDALIRGVALKEPSPTRRRGLLFAALVTVVLTIFAVFYLPYFYWVVAGKSASVTYFGWLPNQYLNGLWPELPKMLNLGLSWSALLAAKILYLTGLRPSFGGTIAPLVVLRILPGIIMLPGLLWLLIRAEWRVRLFVVFFLAPILLGISQDRYILPLQPVLFFYGAKAWEEIIKFCLRLRSIAA